MGHADGAPGLQALCRPGRRLGRAHRRPDGRCRRLRGCSASTPTWPARFRPRSTRASRAARRRPASTRRRSTRTTTLRLLLHERPWLCAGDGEPAADALRNRGFADRPRRLDHRPRHLEPTGMIARVFDGEQRGPDARRHPRQHHPLLADQHGGLGGAPLLGEQAAPSSLRSGVKIPVVVSVFPDEICPIPKKWAEKAYPKLIYYRKHPEGRALRGLGAAASARRRPARRLPVAALSI